MKDVQYVFDCPVHGHRAGVLCFRAFSKEHRDRWEKHVVETEEVEFEIGELDTFLTHLIGGIWGHRVHQGKGREG